MIEDHYDYLIVGAGLFGATFAYRARQQGKKCLVIDILMCNMIVGICLLLNYISIFL